MSFTYLGMVFVSRDEMAGWFLYSQRKRPQAPLPVTRVAARSQRFLAAKGIIAKRRSHCIGRSQPPANDSNKKGRGQTLEGTESIESQVLMDAMGTHAPSDTARQKNIRPSVSFPPIQE